MPWTWAERFDTLPCALEPKERKILARLRLSDQTVGHLCKTFRGLPYQRHLQKTGRIPVLGGRDLARWHIRSHAGYLPTKHGQELALFQQPKLVFQNIIAHIGRPVPHIRLIGAFDDIGTVTLDTVNNLVSREAAVDLWGMLALLHSDLVNWFVHAVVYNKAIRTMHFDQYFLNKIPLPPDADELLAVLAPLARKATRLVAQKAAADAVLRAINSTVNDAYGVVDMAK
jgi:hypothetical protein